MNWFCKDLQFCCSFPWKFNFGFPLWPLVIIIRESLCASHSVILMLILLTVIVGWRIIIQNIMVSWKRKGVGACSNYWSNKLPGVQRMLISKLYELLDVHFLHTIISMCDSRTATYARINYANRTTDWVHNSSVPAVCRDNSSANSCLLNHSVFTFSLCLPKHNQYV